MGWSAISNSAARSRVDTGTLMMLLPEDEVGNLGLSRGERVIVVVPLET